MQGMAGLALKLAAGVAADHARAAGRRAALLGLAALAALTGLGFALSVGWMALARWQGAMVASGALAGGFLLLAGVLVAVARHRPKPQGISAQDIAALEAQAAAIAAAAPEVLARHPLLPLTGAFLGGLLLALKLTR